MSEARYQRTFWWHFGLMLSQACLLSFAAGASLVDAGIPIALKAFCVAGAALGLSAATWALVSSVRRGFVLAAQRGAIEALQEASEVRRDAEHRRAFTSTADVPVPRWTVLS
jgi:hypothetical protein